MVDMLLSDPSNQNRITEDIVVPFSLENSCVSGRILRLNNVLSKVLHGHNYPLVVKKILAELLSLATILGTISSRNEVVTLQIQSNGPITFMLAKCSSQGNIRGYAKFDEKIIHKLGDKPQLDQLFTKAGIVVTIQDENHNILSQSILDMIGDNVTDCFVGYFQSYANMNVRFANHVRCLSNNNWCIASVLLQRVNEESNEQHEEMWNNANIILNTIKNDELVDTSVSLHNLLYRLYNEDGVRVFEPTNITANCSCSRTKIENALRSMSTEEVLSLIVGDIITVNCEFCGKDEVFSNDDLEKL
jgi:molecular chaperone Hsp33